MRDPKFFDTFEAAKKEAEYAYTSLDYEGHLQVAERKHGRGFVVSYTYEHSGEEEFVKELYSSRRYKVIRVTTVRDPRHVMENEPKESNKLNSVLEVYTAFNKTESDANSLSWNGFVKGLHYANVISGKLKLTCLMRHGADFSNFILKVLSQELKEK